MSREFYVAPHSRDDTELSGLLNGTTRRPQTARLPPSPPTTARSSRSVHSMDRFSTNPAAGSSAPYAPPQTDRSTFSYCRTHSKAADTHFDPHRSTSLPTPISGSSAPARGKSPSSHRRSESHFAPHSSTRFATPGPWSSLRCPPAKTLSRNQTFPRSLSSPYSPRSRAASTSLGSH